MSVPGDITLAGVDLAWQTDKNPTAIAIGILNANRLCIDSVAPAVIGLDNVQEHLFSIEKLQGIAIDAPLIINNQSGQRACEKELAKDYASRKAACHPANLNLYPDAASVQLGQFLLSNGFDHLGLKCWQIECYPHPSIIECFGLPERLLYKKGNVEEKKRGQVHYAELIKTLKHSDVLCLHWPDEIELYLDEQRILSLKGRAVKTNEDVLDAILCVYIAALYQRQVTSKTYGDIKQGYIWIPQQRCA